MTRDLAKESHGHACPRQEDTFHSAVWLASGPLRLRIWGCLVLVHDAGGSKLKPRAREA
jgi:hypothetical protein